MLKSLTLCTCLALTALTGLAQEDPERTTLEAARREVEGVLAQLHRAAAQADAGAFFQCFADDAIYFGTDAAERWSLPQLRALLEPEFARGSGWNTKALEVHVQVAEGGRLAWFDERLQSARWGPMRGSGVLRRQDGRWKLVQYNTAFTIPNAFVRDMVEQLRALEDER